HDKAVKVRDATHLAKVFNERPFLLTEAVSRELALDEPEFLLDWECWTELYTLDRPRMAWKPDAWRKRLTDQIQEFLASESHPVFRLWGPPGVGKTRLVHHVLEQAG